MQEQPAFRENTQGSQVLELVWSKLLPAYLDFHRDLLFHQEPEALLNGFFLGKAIEAVLVQGGPWTEEDRIISDAIRHSMISSDTVRLRFSRAKARTVPSRMVAADPALC